MKTFRFFLLAFLAFSFNACTAEAQDATTKRDFANIRAAYEALNQRNWDAFSALCTDDYVEVNVGPAPTKGLKNAIELYKQFAVGFPDFKLNILDIAPAGGGKYLIRMHITGTNTGPFMGLPATGKTINFKDADIVILNKDGKCTSHEITNTREPLVQIGYGSMLIPSTQVVMQAYEKFGKGDVEGISALCADNVVFEIEDHNFDIAMRTFKGKKEVAKFFEELASRIKYSKFQPVRFVADGDDVFILIDSDYEVAATKKHYSSSYIHHFKVSDGKITYFNGSDGFAQEVTSMK